MQALVDLARTLLAEGRVQVVIGWEQGPRGVRPCFVTAPDDADRLVFDARCVHDLATYLSPRRAHVRSLGTPAVVVKGCDNRAVAALVREAQLARDAVVLIGVRCGGVGRDPDGPRTVAPDTLADRCADCDVHEPSRVDYVVGDPPPAVAGVDRRRARIEAIEGLPTAGRLAFWLEELARCVRCHACREVCPLCTCARCVADKADPQWIERSPHPRANLAWHLTRALHLAGRCVDCGECERACPADIPLTLLARKLAQVTADRFGHRVTEDPDVPAPIGTYRTDDGQEFIR